MYFLIQKCHLHSIASPYGSISAQKRQSATSKTGYSFVSCVVSGSGYIYLGRAWGAYSRVVFSYTYLLSIIRPEGWNDFGVPSNQRWVLYFCNPPYLSTHITHAHTQTLILHLYWNKTVTFIYCCSNIKHLHFKFHLWTQESILWWI